jgi:hypothetical protein
MAISAIARKPLARMSMRIKIVSKVTVPIEVINSEVISTDDQKTQSSAA